MWSSDWNFEVAARHLKAQAVFPNPQKLWTGASIDTRSLKPGEVFFALGGKNRDGHECLREAFQKGASGAVIREDYFRAERESFFRERALFQNLLPVADPAAALAVLAGHYRSHFSAVGVGVTGSVGKTGTKEFVRFILGQKYPILATAGNLNNHLGLPLTLFRLQPEHQYCVAELGASRRGEIRKLSALLRPSVGVITGVSPAHLAGFGSLSEVYEAKLELAASLAAAKGVLVLPDHDPELLLRAKQRKVQTLLYGREKTSDFRLTGVRAREGWVEFEVNDRWQFRFPGHTTFQAENAMAALAVGFACGVSPADLPPVWKEIESSPGRFQPVPMGDGILFVNDCYNASPYSFERALEAFQELEPEGRGRKILVLGDMRELGTESRSYHHLLGERIREGNFHALFTVGDQMRQTAAVCEEGGNPPLVLHFDDREMLVHFLSGFLKSGDQVLFKASRALCLEEVLNALSIPLSVA